MGDFVSYRRLMAGGLPAIAGLAIALGSMGAAQAQPSLCPSGPAVDGVYISFADRVVRYQLLSNGQTAEREVFTGDGASYEYRTHPIGMSTASWELVSGRILAGSYETITTSATSGPMPAPAPGVVWSGTEDSRFADGSSSRYAFTIEVDGLDTLDIGPCTYSGYPITITRTDLADGYMSQDAFGYIADLGIVIFLGFGEGEGNISYDFPNLITSLPPNDDGSALLVDNK